MIKNKVNFLLMSIDNSTKSAVYTLNIPPSNIQDLNLVLVYFCETSSGQDGRERKTVVPTNIEDMTTSAKRRLMSNMQIVLTLLDEEHGEYSSIVDQKACKSQILFIPDNDQETLTELECIRCEFSGFHLLTTHRLKSVRSSPFE